jgi:hypothetical protein
MQRFYVVAQGNPWTEEQTAKIVKEAAQELAVDAGEDPEKVVIDLKDKIKVLGCFLDRADAEQAARDEAQNYPERPIFVLHPYCMFEAEERPVNRTTIY